MPLARITRALGAPTFHPSDLTRDPAYRALPDRRPSREHAIAELTAAGEVVRRAPPAAPLHRQAEGLAFAADGALLVGDEASGKRATLTVYPRAQLATHGGTAFAAGSISA